MLHLDFGDHLRLPTRDKPLVQRWNPWEGDTFVQRLSQPYGIDPRTLSSLSCTKPRHLASTSPSWFACFLGQLVVTRRQRSPAWDMSQPREKLNQVSTWSCGGRDTVGEIIDIVGGLILF